MKNIELLQHNIIKEKNITKAEEISPYLNLSKDEEVKLNEILKKYPMSITPYYLSLVDFNDPDDPIKKCVFLQLLKQI